MRAVSDQVGRRFPDGPGIGVDDIDMMGTMRRGRGSHAEHGLSFDEAVERVPFLYLLTPPQRDRLRAVSTIQTTPQGEAVWSMDEPTGAYSFLIAGHVKLLRPREDGRDVILDIRGPGELL